MNSKDQNIQTAPFVELVAVPSALAKNPVFDIIIDEKITLQNYCNALIEKIFTLRQSDFPAFIDYQSSQVKNTIVWLNKLEKLIANNEEIFASKHNMCRFTKLMNLIELKRKEVQSSPVKDLKTKTPRRLINADAENRYFSFHEVKQHIETLENFNDKIIYLSEEIFDYEEADIISKNSNLGEFNLQCEKLKVRLQTTRKLLLDIEKEQLQNQNKTTIVTDNFEKIQLNGPLNIISNAFKQMMTTVKPNGKPYIDNKIVVVAHFLSEIFLDENGERISQATLQTYLSPNRTDKDPNNDVKVKL